MDSLKCGSVDNPNVSAANRANRTNNAAQLVQITQIALFAGATAEIGCRSTTLAVITLKSADMFHQIHTNGQHANTQIQAHKRNSRWHLKSGKHQYFHKKPAFHTKIVERNKKRKIYCIILGRISQVRSATPME